MVVDDFIDIRIKLGSDELEKIDQQIDKAKKKIKDSRQSDSAFESEISSIEQRINKDQVLQFGSNKESRLKNLFGDNIGSNLLSIGTNPSGFLKGALLGLGAFAGVGFGLTIAQAVIDQIQKIDSFLKVFIDLIDTRVNQLREPTEQARIRAGQVQVILTTEAGTTDPREAYNTFEQFNNNRAQLEEDFAVRNTSGFS